MCVSDPWRQMIITWWRFTQVRPMVVEMYDERFARMWELYLAACECVFDYGTSHVFQIQLGRERGSVPLTRDYLEPAKAALAEREPAWLDRFTSSAREALDA
jgi:cyclopropane-fatty-acyl-phospholipid synthase